jgi:hypothetical protein
MRYKKVNYRYFTLLRCLCWFEVSLLCLALVASVE